MKKQTMYNHLQKQYAKLNLRIQKAMQTGRFYAYTQFKQEQLLNRLKRCSFQLKQLGAGVAVVAALGMATPAVGQVDVYELVERTGIDNLLDTITSTIVDYPIFVDIDADGDLDVFYINNYAMNFFENTGNVYSPNWEARTGAANPLDGVVTNGFDFVDIDADGDKDLFTTNDLYSGTSSFNYYENQGTPTSPNFVLQSLMNPLDSITTHLNAVTAVTGVAASALPAFVDIDADGDMDCFVSIIQYSYGGPTWQSDEKVWYYENQGDSSQADFFKQPKSNNPLYPLMQNLALDAWVISRPTFFDAEKDGDMDLLLNIADNEFSGTKTTPFYENIGTPVVADFDSSLVHPLDSVLLPVSVYNNIYLVDIDGDSDLDVYRRATIVPGRVFFENLDTTINVSLDKIEEKELLSDFLIYPNPSKGILSLERPLTGKVHVFGTDGKEIYFQKIENTQILDLSSIKEGMYILKIETETEQIIKNVFIEK